MNSTATWESEVLEPAANPEENSESAAARNNVTALRELVLRLLCEVQSMNEVGSVAIENGFDFYDEVSRFEIDLIRRALVQTGGHQVQAAKLLNLKVTTLNSKIKHYQISLNGLGNVYPLIEPNQHQELQHA
ncbi:MAG TPA: helix-turn-helix domain-containing protein [Pyrinomonadaceae bacterium]|nr:helix-turn-helix domain-containing protein [Pyrinomonadaceae bacterium]